MNVTKPYEFIDSGVMDVTKPYEFMGLGGTPVCPGSWSGPGTEVMDHMGSLTSVAKRKADRPAPPLYKFVYTFVLIPVCRK